VNALSDRFLFEIRDERVQPRVRRIEGYQLARVAERLGKVSLVLLDGDQGGEHISVRWVLLMRSLQQREGVSGGTGRIQRDGVDISVARVVRGQFVSLIISKRSCETRAKRCAPRPVAEPTAPMTRLEPLGRVPHPTACRLDSGVGTSRVLLGTGWQPTERRGHRDRRSESR
jgi:hypothetical protein